MSGGDPLAGLAGPPIFIVGHARSGTTWAFDVLEAHPDVAGVFESWLFDGQRGLASLFDAAHWDRETRTGFEGKVGREIGLPGLVGRERLVADVRAMAGGWLAGVAGPDRWVVEKSPVHLHAVPVIAEVFPQARFVELVRDGRDVAVSTLAAARSWNPGLLRRGEEEGPLQTVGREWAASMATGRRAAEDLGPERWLRVRYEDLHSTFGASVSAMYRFCGLPVGAEQVERARRDTDFANYASGEDQFRRAGRVGDWRERFSQEEARRFDGVAGDALVESGYAADRSWWRDLEEPGLLRRLVPTRR